MALDFSCSLLCVHVYVKAGLVGEEKAVPNQTMNFTHEEDAGGVGVYVRRAEEFPQELRCSILS